MSWLFKSIIERSVSGRVWFRIVLISLQLQDTAMEQASEVFVHHEDHDLLLALKRAGTAGETERVAEISVKFEEHAEQLQEVGYYPEWIWKKKNFLEKIFF